ncbi:MAG TPA: hypothetical protein VN374_02730, partial [Desulfitobacteriaceae bacterium]|nr:hypothetical protein [Desulfitobacteriaceae bacterium]
MDHLLNNWSAPDLAQLNHGGVVLMRKHISRILKEIREIKQDKIRILDIGCGNSPYLKGVDLSNV